MTKKKWVAALALTALLTTAAAAQDAKTVIANATKAMGYGSLNTIEYTGPISYEGLQIGQWQGPQKGWHQNTVKNFSRFIDYAAGTSQRTGLQSRPGDPKTGLLPGGGGLDPAMTNGVPNETQNTSVVAATGNWTARLEVTLSPPAFLKLAAAATGATAKSQTVDGKRYTVVSFPVEQKAPSGVAYTLTGYIDGQNMLDKVETAYEDANPFLIGDVLVEQTYTGYKDFGGVKFPTHITQKRGGVVWNDTTIAEVKPNAPAPPPPAAGAGGGGGRGGGGGAPGGGGGGGGAAPGGAGGGGRGGGAPAGAPAAPGGGQGGAPAGAPAGAPGAGAPGGGRGGAGAAAAAPGGGGAGGGGAAGGAQGAGRGGAGGAGGAQAAGGRGGAPAAPRKLADGVYVITSGNRVLVVEFKDHYVLIDAPANTADIIAQAKTVIPNKPLTHVISTHIHFDHAGGLRTAAAEGPMPVTIVSSELNKPVIEKWFSNPRTLQASTPPAGAAAAAPAPAGGGRGGAGGAGGGGGAAWPDALQQSGKKVKFEYVKDKLVMKDDTRTLELHVIKGAVHSDDMIVAYLPKEKVIFESDAYNPGAVGAVTTGTGQLAFQKLLASELDRLKLDYTTIVSGHAPGGGGDRDATKQDLMVAIGKAPAPTPAAPAAAPAPRGQ